MKKHVITKTFGKFVLDDNKLKKFMNIFEFCDYKKIKNEHKPLNEKIAKSIAKAMKTWAMKNGATHFSHWFLPLTGKTAEKQTSFIEVCKSGKIIEEFNEKSLIKGETDASSFPNGGERLTFEARGYTVWDYTSPAFIKEDFSKNRTLYIPTAFCSYTGTALDEKTPLLRSIECLNNASLKMLKLLGYKKIKYVNCNVGGEQEYFLIDKDIFLNRTDLKIVGRTLFGDKPIKSQEITSHYYGMIDELTSCFMNDVDNKLWEMGIMAKIQHNEVAPKQHELVPIFTPANIASDQNQLIMEVLREVAKKHNYVALFSEKPFKHINGSGKHINWSLSTNTGINLFDFSMPDKRLFLVFFTAMICSVCDYYNLIRLSSASRENDLRLGGNEAPPTIISMFVGNYVESMLNNFSYANSKHKLSVLDTGVKLLPKTIKDFCDRNRTSPFAFTGNKFEFRMVGSSQTIAWPCTCLCAAMANTLNNFVTELEKTPLTTENLLTFISKKLNTHKKIVFNGNSYDPQWQKEAENRGLKNFKTTPDCFKIFDDKKVVELFEKTNVLNKCELNLRKTTFIKTYLQNVLIEGKTMFEMTHKNIIPALFDCLNNLKQTKNKTSLELYKKFEKTLNYLFNYNKKLSAELNVLEDEIKNLNLTVSVNKTLDLMNKIRTAFDEIESYFPSNLKPFPNYNDILFE